MISFRKTISEKPSLGLSVNWENPITDRLAGFWMFNENGGDIVQDISNNTKGYITRGTGGWYYFRNKYSYKFNGTNTLVNCSSSFKFSTISGVTYIASIFPLTMGESNIGTIVAKGTSATTNRMILAFDGTAASNNMRFFRDYGTQDLTARIPLIMGVWQTLAVTWNGSATATNVKMYVDGTEKTPTVQNGTGTVGSDQNIPLYIGNRSDASSTFNGYISYVIQWNRVLQKNEIQSLFLNPYQLIQPSRSRIFYSPDAQPQVGLGIMTTRTRWWGDL